ncbi:MAG: TIM barrel protein, partial [Planctomycetota bacterium]
MSRQSKEDDTRPAEEQSPRINLAIDNCFASKRWTQPGEWARIVKQLGLSFVEASADTECDPLYSDPAYLEDWVGEVKAACEATGVRLANLYSGHGTYATLGLGHTDARNRRRMLDEWLKVMARNASRLEAGLGFYCHAFCEAVLQDRRAYEEAERQLYDDLAELAAYAGERGVRAVGVEQMYTPHQLPWTISTAKRLMRQVLMGGGNPLYITIDTGHQTGQGKFRKPNRRQLRRALERFGETGRVGGLWLGTRTAYEHFRRAAASSSEKQAHLRELEAEMARNEHLFASREDASPYAWLAQLACYSPIIHLQQTDGSASDHRPFTSKYNRQGKIEPGRLLKAVAASYARPAEPDMPLRCAEIYMTLEIFPQTTDTAAEILEDLAESVHFWRRHIPQDGLRLRELP